MRTGLPTVQARLVSLIRAAHKTPVQSLRKVRWSMSHAVRRVKPRCEFEYGIACARIGTVKAWREFGPRIAGEARERATTSGRKVELVAPRYLRLFEGF